MRIKALPAVMAVNLAGVLLPVGAAAAPGVIADPDSPPGKQYALPLDDARKDGSGGDRGVAVASHRSRFPAVEYPRPSRVGDSRLRCGDLARRATRFRVVESVGQGWRGWQRARSSGRG